MNISIDTLGRIIVSFPYDPLRVEKIKNIPAHRRHPDKKCWSFPNTDGTLTPHSPLNLRGDEGGLAFEGEEIHLDPALNPSSSPFTKGGQRGITAIELGLSSKQIPSLAKRGDGRFSEKNYLQQPLMTQLKLEERI